MNKIKKRYNHFFFCTSHHIITNYETVPRATQRLSSETFEIDTLFLLLDSGMIK